MINRKVLASLVVIGIVGAVAGTGTLAYFNDTETSSDNTFTAGAVDLGIDVEGEDVEEFDGQTVYGQGEDATAVPAFFSYGPTDDTRNQDVKPGDVYERTLSLHVDNNPSYVCAAVIPTEDGENGINEPEDVAGDTSSNDGELDEFSDLHIWTDGIEGQSEDAGDNQFTDDANHQSVVGPERTLPSPEDGPVTWTIADSNQNIFPGESGALEGDQTYYIAAEYSLPHDQSNINQVQTDSYVADVWFYAVQERNNEEFSCEDVGPNMENVEPLDQ